VKRREFITLLGDAAPKLALRSTPAGMMVRAAPTRDPNGVVCPPAHRCVARALTMKRKRLMKG
jgi:hypothetical protein